MLVDSHCHLDFKDFDNRAEVIARAKAAGVTTMVTISTLVANYEIYKAIAESDPRVFFTTGTHPHQADVEPDVPAEKLVELSKHPKCIGIGEVGLDYFYQKASRENQAKTFHTHIDAARETGLPLIIHTRDAEDDTARILLSEMKKGEFKAVLHCFTANEFLAKTALELGLYISFSGVVTYKSAPNLREIANWMPADKILVETDAPYLAPGKMRGKTNEPAFVVETARTVGEARGLSLEAMAKITSNNFFTLFTKASRE